MRRIGSTALALALCAGAGGAVTTSAGASSTDQAVVATTRPLAEHVPRSLSHVRLAYRTSPFDDTPRTTTIHAKRAHRLVKIFDALLVESRSAVHCEIAGGPETTVTFRTRKHTWVAVESACSDLRVTLDGSRLPTLVPTSAWDKATTADLRH